MVVLFIVVVGDVVRVYLVFCLNEEVLVYWNNELELFVVWFEVLSGWSVVELLLCGENVVFVVSIEMCWFEVELMMLSDLMQRVVEVLGFVLYYVCEDENGICFYC